VKGGTAGRMDIATALSGMAGSDAAVPGDTRKSTTTALTASVSGRVPERGPLIDDIEHVSFTSATLRAPNAIRHVQVACGRRAMYMQAYLFRPARGLEWRRRHS